MSDKPIRFQAGMKSLVEKLQGLVMSGWREGFKAGHKRAWKNESERHIDGDWLACKTRKQLAEFADSADTDRQALAEAVAGAICRATGPLQTARVGIFQDAATAAIEAYEQFKTYSTPLKTEQVGNGSSLVLATPTERMCDGARGFIMGLDLGCRRWSAMKKHLDSGGYDCLPYIRQKAKDDPNGHITKWDVADCIWQLMQRCHPVGNGSEASAEAAATVPQLAPAEARFEWSGGEHAKSYSIERGKKQP